MNETHILVEGIFLGDESMWKDAVETSGASEATSITSTDLLDAATEMTFSNAVNSLTDWNPKRAPVNMLQPFQGKDRTYFKYKSLFLFQPLPAEAIHILIDKAMYFEENYSNKKNYIVFEFQALGGDPGKPDESDEDYPYLSPKNMFASVSPKDTAFPHRGALHCLILKTNINMLVSGGFATRLLMDMEAVYDRIESFVKGKASYYNYVDPNLQLEIPYFQNGVELNPGITDGDKNYWVDRLREVKSKYNPNDMLSNPLGIVTKPPETKIETAVSNSACATTASSVFIVFLSGYLLFHASICGIPTT